MTNHLESLSCKISGLCWDNHYLTSFRSRNFMFTSDRNSILAVFHVYISPKTNTQHWANILNIVGQSDTLPSCSGIQQDWLSVEHACWLWLIPSWCEAYYIFLKTSYLFSLSSSSPCRHQQNVTTETPLPGESGSGSSNTIDASSNTSLFWTQQQCRHQSVHCHTVNTATVNMTQHILNKGL